MAFLQFALFLGIMVAVAGASAPPGCAGEIKACQDKVKDNSSKGKGLESMCKAMKEGKKCLKDLEGTCGKKGTDETALNKAFDSMSKYDKKCASKGGCGSLKPSLLVVMAVAIFVFIRSHF